MHDPDQPVAAASPPAPQQYPDTVAIRYGGNVLYFKHSSEIWGDFPELVAGTLFTEGIGKAVDKDVDVAERLGRFCDIASGRLVSNTEGEFPEIQAWRRAFSRMGLKPTQYRCASESLLRRFRKEGSLPAIHPLIDICNAVSLAFAIPIAVFDIAEVAEYLEVRYATGAETYLTFSGEIEHPEPREVIFADAANRAHARRWTNRQSRYSAVQGSTDTVLIVAEGLHSSAATDVPQLLSALADELNEVWAAVAKPTILNAGSPRFDF
jgi:DNA/RNA-binding domain of Phe-tRNA-synthetase-like protein